MALLNGADAPAADLNDHLATHTGAFHSGSKASGPVARSSIIPR